MPLGNNHIAEGAAGVGSFIPQEWSSLVIAQYDAKTALKGIVSQVPHKANNGDTINVPVEGIKQAPSRKLFQTQVNLKNHQSSNVQIKVDRQFEYSYLN